MRPVLTALCLFTLAAACWLAITAVVLHRGGYEAQVALALLIALESLLTLALRSRVHAAARMRVIAAAGAVGIAAVGARAIALNLTRSHFEGYAVVIGAALVLQSLLTLWSLARRRTSALGRTAPIW